jgi:hypothetical protein
MSKSQCRNPRSMEMKIKMQTQVNMTPKLNNSIVTNINIKEVDEILKN